MVFHHKIVILMTLHKYYCVVLNIQGWFRCTIRCALARSYHLACISPGTVEIVCAAKEEHVCMYECMLKGNYLSKEYRSHINQRAYTTVKSVTYLFKYVYKVYDCANIQVTASDELTHDEVTSFINARYVSAPEAFWRLSEFEMHKQSHSIVRLPVHLPDQRVSFTEGKHEEAVQNGAAKHTMLTAWFELNRAQPQPYKYTEIPNHFIFQTSTGKWRARKNKQSGKNIIGRMYYISPRIVEEFCLRLILLYTTGAISFDDENGE